ncbi:MAG: SH3 domain-containing protein [Myxococcota bacterium]
MRRLVTLGLVAAVATGCGTASDAVVTSDTLTGADEWATVSDGLNTSLPIGSTLATTANLNLRTGPSTSNSIRLVVPKGGRLQTINRTTPEGSWYNVSYNGTTGWVHGGYVTLVESGTPSAPSTPVSGARDAAIARAKSGVGFSYYWGHGSWIPNGATSSTKGTCTGNCPDCSHSGRYGADCSGFVAKVWQVPSSNTDLTVDSHPYSTYSFNGANSQWRTVSRSSVKPADALVYRGSSGGHIVIYESGDGWGSMWTYEARGCSYGIVHNLRSFGSEYKAIARTGY